MDNENNVCKSCGTLNEPEYKYCKNCGERLVFEDNSTAEPNGGVNKDDFKGQESAYSAPYTAPPPQNGEYTYAEVEAIDGVDIEEISDFIGKKSYKFIPQFIKSEITGSKISWTWPVAVLGFFFGPIGAAIWFFYRKMYKVATVLLCIGLAFSILNAVIVGNSDTAVSNYAAEIGEAFENKTPEEALDSLTEILETSDFMRLSVSRYLNNAINIATMVLCGLFSAYAYKKFVIKMIKKYRSSGIDPRYYRIGLAAFGGTSVGMAILGIVVFIFASNISAAALALFFK